MMRRGQTQNRKPDASSPLAKFRRRRHWARQRDEIRDRTVSASQFDDPAAHRLDDRFSAILDVELEENTFEVRFHGVFGDREGARDLLVRRAHGHAAKDFQFSFAERLLARV